MCKNSESFLVQRTYFTLISENQGCIKRRSVNVFVGGVFEVGVSKKRR